DPRRRPVGRLPSLRPLRPPAAACREAARGAPRRVRGAAPPEPRRGGLLGPRRARPGRPGRAPGVRSGDAAAAPLDLGGPRPGPPGAGGARDGQAVPRGRGPLGAVPAHPARPAQAGVLSIAVGAAVSWASADRTPARPRRADADARGWPATAPNRLGLGRSGRPLHSP